MSRNWTANQLRAINASGGSLLVSAAAGSGKTAVLVERVIRLVTNDKEPLPIDRLLVVTYTRAAAAELLTRIRAALDELIAKEPSNSWYRRQLINLPQACISTVDSFCSNIVREFFTRLDITNDFRIADESELALLRKKAADLTLDSLYEEGSEDFFELVESFSSSRNDNKIIEVINNLYLFLRSHPFADAWLDEKLSYYENVAEMRDSVWGRVIIDYSLSAADYLIELSKASLKMMEAEPDLYSKAYSLIDQDILFLQKLKDKLEASSWDDVCDHMSSFSSGVLNARGYKNHPIKLRVSANRDVLKDTVKTISKLFQRKEADCLLDIKAQTPVIKKAFEAVRMFGEQFSKLKKEKNIADFADIEHSALELLVRRNADGTVAYTEEARIISSRFDAVMVDEYQDANEVQDLIFRSVSNDGNDLFVVGDVKQSIYGFRQAMPEIFLNRKNSVPLYNERDEHFPSKVILEQNFRTRREITDFINFVFSKLMSVETGDLDYNDEEKLVAAREYPDTDEPCVELHLLDLDKIGDIEDNIAEARHIAELIRRLCTSTYITDGDIRRLCRPSDIAILMRSPKKVSDIYVNELIRCGVSAVCETTSGFLSSGEIMLAMSFLKVVDNPLEDIPLTCVLMSSVYGFTPDDLAHIKSEDKKLSLYNALCVYAERGDKKSQSFLCELDHLRKVSLTLPADSFIEYVYEYTGLPEICSVLYGEDSVNNLRLLCEYASSYEQGASKGIGAFVGYISQLTMEKKDLSASAKTLEHSGSVRLMSIHASKGLEFPVCILANTAKQFMSDTKDNVLLHSKLGFASKRRDHELSVNYPTTSREAVSLEILRSEKSEELRVLYVALTRAKEKLIITSAIKRMDKHLKKLSGALVGEGAISPFLVRDMKSTADWLIMCALLHKDSTRLREYVGADEDFDMYLEDSGELKVELVTELLLGTSAEREQVTSHIIYEDVPLNADELIRQRFDFEYPHKELCELPVKVTASELAHKESKKQFARVFKKPLFMSGEKLSAAERGTAAHLFLEKCDFLRASLDIEAEIELLRSRDILSDIEAKSLDLSKLTAFFESELTELIRNSSAYYKEYRFTVNVPAHMTDNSLSGDCADQPLILQGAVDLVIVDSDGIIVVDYKTDRVREVDELADMYKKQLELYKYALEQIFSLPVKRSILYSLHLSRIKEVIIK